MVNQTHFITKSIDLVTNEQYIRIIQSTSDFGTIIAFFGVISNIINIRTFVAMGLSDGVTVSFLALAIFDLTYLIASLCLGISVVFYVEEMKSSIRFQVEPYGISVIFVNLTILINITNVLSTTYIAVARCMCVARPLQFKNTFTRQRAIIYMSGFAIFAVVIYIPILTNMGMIDRFDRFSNRTRPSLWVSSNRELIKKIIWLTTDMIFPLVTQFIIIVCVIVMSNSLRAASKFRQSSVMNPETHSEKNTTNVSCYREDQVTDSNATGNTAEKLTRKDLLVVQQVVFISVVYIVCNTPKILISVATAIEPEFTIGKGYTNLYMSANGFRKQFEILNSAVNLIIYYKYNRRFRSTLRRTRFHFKKDQLMSNINR